MSSTRATPRLIETVTTAPSLPGRSTASCQGNPDGLTYVHFVHGQAVSSGG